VCYLGSSLLALVHSLGGRIVFTGTEPRQWRTFVASLRDGHPATIDPTRHRQGAALIEEMGQRDQIAPTATEEPITLHGFDDEIDDNDDDSREPDYLPYILILATSCLLRGLARAYGSKVRFHPLCIRHTGRRACSEPAR
jgi:hypothetical protein